LKQLLARTVANMAAGGWRVESHSDYRAVFARKDWFSFERKQVAEVDEWGNVNIQDMGRRFIWG
jgi:hypothetical protein